MKPNTPKVKKVKAWAIVLDDGSIPDFTITGKFSNVLQIHSTKISAQDLLKKLGGGWSVCKVEISFILPTTHKKK